MIVVSCVHTGAAVEHKEQGPLNDKILRTGTGCLRAAMSIAPPGLIDCIQLPKLLTPPLRQPLALA